MEEFSFGQPLPDLTPKRLRFLGSQTLLAACHRHPDIIVRELRQIECADGMWADGIVIDVDNRQVPARNPYGICSREPLMLVHNESAGLPYEVRALRSDFPLLLHQNAVHEGEPASLCLYEMPWSIVARSWTPSRFLDRMLWWLSRSACGALHAPGQNLEQLFFDNGLRVVVPAGFDAYVSAVPLRLALIKSAGRQTLRPMPASGDGGHEMAALVVTVGSIGHPPLARLPKSLGALADHFARLGSDLVGPLGSSIGGNWPDAGFPANPDQRTLLMLRVPRAIEGALERIDPMAVLLGVAPGLLGVKLGVLDADPESGRLFRSYRTALSGQPTVPHDWRDIELQMAQTLEAPTRDQARFYSALQRDYVDFNAIIGGLGALGSAMFNIWFRSGWGQWTLVDDDTISPHNLVRHTAIDTDIGSAKVAVCAQQAAGIFPAESATPTCESRIDADTEQVRSALAAADLVVDATANLAAARNLSVADHRARAASVFLSPSGQACILLLEDRARHIRLITLEAQYYRAVLESTWGEAHLAVAGVVRPGTTCRDVSFVLPLELVQLHAAILCQQVREGVSDESARIRVWTQEVSGGVTALNVPVQQTRELAVADWTIGWDDGLREKLQALRRDALPTETGGVLFGIIDTALMRIQIVDALPAADDSVGSATGFTRGTLGVEQAEAEARRRTHGAVEYVGDWHSHPPGHSTKPSVTDMLQVASLAERLDAEDIPALIGIVGEPEADLSWTLGYSVRLDVPSP